MTKRLYKSNFCYRPILFHVNHNYKVTQILKKYEKVV